MREHCAKMGHLLKKMCLNRVLKIDNQKELIAKDLPERDIFKI